MCIRDRPKGRGGEAYVFVMLDTFSKFVKFYSVKRATSKVLSEKVTWDYMVNVGKPKVILSDHGPQFVSGKWRQTQAHSSPTKRSES